jgi:hypothetical protein
LYTKLPLKWPMILAGVLQVFGGWFRMVGGEQGAFWPIVVGCQIN